MAGDSEWTLLAHYDFGYEVDLVEATLQEAGIPAWVQGREVGIWGPGFVGAPTRGLAVWVPGERLDEARGLIDLDPAE